MNSGITSLQHQLVSNASLQQSPVEYADQLGLAYSRMVSLEHKKKLGQFFTPIDVAVFLSGFVKTTSRTIRILDPGCGAGVLSCALIEFIINNNSHVKEIDLTAFESDVHIIPFAEKSFAFLREWLSKRQIHFNHYLCANDFILHNSTLLNNQETIHEKFDVIIANPPYFKIPRNDIRAIASKSIIHGQTNIYSIFLIVSARLLEKNGQLIFITPRSFASGSYFRLFREVFFSLVKFKTIHVFSSRRETFARDSILQENVIIYAEKRNQDRSKNKGIDFSYKVEISTSTGMADVAKRNSKTFFFSDLVNSKSKQQILHLPSSSSDEKAIKVFKSWTDTLNSYGIEISTGPVVDFRNTEVISSTKDSPNCVPLIWLNNVKEMEFEWPFTVRPRGKEKGQYIKVNKESKSKLIANRNYVFLRRFSSKDDQSRLTACHYFRKWLPQYSHIGVENHLNYIYKKTGQLKRIEVLGIAALLNSRLFDIYFRTFNGNINVSATELREMPFPSLRIIEVIGGLVNKATVKKGITDSIIESIFKINLSEHEQ